MSPMPLGQEIRTLSVSFETQAEVPDRKIGAGEPERKGIRRVV